MRRFWAVALALSLVLVFSATNVSAKSCKYPKYKSNEERVYPWSRMFHSGDIKGQVVQCAGGDFAKGVLVFVSGTSFMAMTDEDGKFTIYNVPQGIYENLAVVLPGQPAQVIKTSVRVKGKMVTDLGIMGENLACQPQGEPSIQPPSAPGVGDVSITPNGFDENYQDVFVIQVSADSGSTLNVYVSEYSTEACNSVLMQIPPEDQDEYGTFSFSIAVSSAYNYVSFTVENEAGVSECSGVFDLRE